uniref:chromogranin-A n=1 Tax=Monopterus albus TaxID=43700 RepID=UPI0009B420D4|nr:chromogranin-A [Monopterus albus]
MIGSGLFVLILMSNCVLSLPVTSSQLENEDVKVMKCIIEALADVLSRPHPVPVSEDCLATLRADNRLVTILRHHNFLKELQEIGVHGGQERAQLRSGADTPAPTAQAPQRTDAAADRSMLEALGGPGERSLLAQKRRTGGGGEEKENNERLRDGVSQQDSDIAEEAQVKRENDESLGSHISQYVDEWNEDKPENREEEEEEEEEEEDYEEKRANSEEESMTKDRNGAGSDEKRDAPKYKSKVKKYDEEENNKRFAPFSRNQEEEEEEEKESEMKTGSRESLERATRRGNRMRLKKKTGVPHHSKEVTEKEEEKKKRDPGRTPEEKELQMIAQRAPEERRVSEEEGSASRKLEESEIESLAAIESELENVAQKLHELRQG